MPTLLHDALLVGLGVLVGGWLGLLFAALCTAGKERD